MLEDVAQLQVLLGRLHAYVPYGSQLWHEVAKARGLKKREPAPPLA